MSWLHLVKILHLNPSSQSDFSYDKLALFVGAKGGGSL